MFDYKNAEKILEAEDVVVKFNLRGKTLTAIRGISMELYKGESLACGFGVWGGCAFCADFNLSRIDSRAAGFFGMVS